MGPPPRNSRPTPDRSRGKRRQRLAVKPLAEMLTLLSSQGIPLTDTGQAAADETRKNMHHARDWLANSGS